MLGNEEQNQSVVLELSGAEFKEQVNLARAVLNEVYETSTPLLALGYSGAQMRILHSVYDAVRQGDAVDAKRNLNYPFYRHNARFENKSGYLAITFSGNKDFRIQGGVDEIRSRREKFPIGTHPHLFLLQKAFGQDIELSSLAERVFRGKYTGQAGTLKKALAKFSLTKETPQVRDSYTCEWLDDDTKRDAVFYFPVRDEYVVFRKLHQNDGYETWGEKQNVRSDRIREALSQKKQSQTLVFQPSPVPIPVRV